MSLFTLSAIILTVVAFIAFLNERFIKLPTAIGVIAISLVVSLLIPLTGYMVPSVNIFAHDVIKSIDFKEVVFHGVLGFLLFAGALHIDLRNLRAQALPVALLATVSVVISTVIVGFLTSMVGIYLFHLEISTIWYYVFGALISPTDPVAVLALMKKLNAPKQIETKIAGESLFNDGTAVVVFTVILAMAIAPEHASPSFAARELMTEAGGGLLYGAVLGLVGNWLIGKIDSYEVETMITLAMASAGYSLAEYLHVSAPLAVVVAGIIVGNFSQGRTMSQKTEERLFGFWHMLDELLNLMLFSLMGLYVMTVHFTTTYLVIGGFAIVIALFARWVSVGAPIRLLSTFREIYPGSIRILTWGGLKGGISVALVLSLPEFKGKELLVVMTYAVVLFSMLVQGLSVGKLITKIGERNERNFYDSTGEEILPGD